MPYNTRYRKSSRRFQKKRSTFKRRFKPKRTMQRTNKSQILYRGLKNTAIPPTYKTKFSIYAAVSLAGGLVSTKGAILANVLTHPFNNAINGFWTGLVPPTYATLNPTGLSSLLESNVYSQYRVYATKLKLSLSCAGTDTILFAVLPINQSAAAATYAGNTYYTISGQPMCKHTTATAARSGIINMYCPTHLIWGVPYQSVRDDVSGAYVGTVATLPVDPWYYMVWIQAVDTADDNVTIQAELTFYAELFSPQYGQLLEI